MLISQVIEDIAFGELKNIHIKNDKASLVSFINQALLALYVKYDLKTSETIITLDGYSTNYSLPDDCMKVLEVYDENGNKISINNEKDPLGVFLPEEGIIQVPEPTEGLQLSVLYSASPERIVYDSNEDTYTPNILKLNLGLYEALLNYVAYKAFSSVNGETNTENNVYLLRYVNSCKQAELTGIFAEDVVSNTKLEERGFV